MSTFQKCFLCFQSLIVTYSNENINIPLMATSLSHKMETSATFGVSKIFVTLLSHTFYIDIYFRISKCVSCCVAPFIRKYSWAFNFQTFRKIPLLFSPNIPKDVAGQNTQTQNSQARNTQTYKIPKIKLLKVLSRYDYRLNLTKIAVLWFYNKEKLKLTSRDFSPKWRAEDLSDFR